MPMVWYIPPLSPVVDVAARQGHDGEDLDNLFGALEALRIPMDYLAGLFTAGDTGSRSTGGAATPRRDAVLPCATSTSARDRDESSPTAVGMTGEQMYEMYRLLAIAKYEERYVIPSAYAAEAPPARGAGTECSLDFDGGPGMDESGPFGEASGTTGAVAVETFHALRAAADRPTSAANARGTQPG